MTPRLKDSRFRNQLAVMALLTIIAYIPAVRGNFTWDDDQYIQNNSLLKTPEGLVKIWLDFGLIPQYYPLTFTTFWLENHIWGLNPVAFHIDNVLLHLAGAIVLWTVLQDLEIPGAWAIAMIFAIHPIQVESVAWAMERKNILSGLLFLLSLKVYLKARPLNLARSGRAAGRQTEGSNVRVYLISLILFLLALLSKSTASSLPAVILVLTWWKRGKITIKDIRPLIPFFVLGISMGLITGWMERTYVGAVGPYYDFTIPQRFIIAGRAIWFYALKILFPAKLIFFYPRWNLDVSHRWLFFFPASAAIAVIALWLLRRKFGRGPIAAVLIFGGMLFPALGFVNIYPMKFSFVADHFQYLGGVAFVSLTVAGAMRFIPTISQYLLLPILIFTLAALTFHRGRVYENQQTLWIDTIAKNPDSISAHANYGSILMNLDAKKAKDEFQKVLILDPHHVNARLNLGAMARTDGDFTAAIKWFTQALDQLPPTDNKLLRAERYDPNFNLATTYIQMAEATTDTSQADKDRQLAGQAYQLAIEADPKRLTAHYYFGNLLLFQGHLDQAMEQFRTIIQLDPSVPAAHENLATALQSKGNLKEAADEFKIAGDRYRDKNDLPNAITCYSAALAQNPNLLSAQSSLESIKAERIK